MTDSIAEAAVALSLMLEALGLLDAPEHGVVAAHLRSAIDELSPVGRGSRPRLALRPTAEPQRPSSNYADPNFIATPFMQ